MSSKAKRLSGKAESGEPAAPSKGEPGGFASRALALASRCGLATYFPDRLSFRFVQQQFHLFLGQILVEAAADGPAAGGFAMRVLDAQRFAENNPVRLAE